jgi:hypothetical protein
VFIERTHNVELHTEDLAQDPVHVWTVELEVPVHVVDLLSGYSVPGVLQGFTPGEVMVSLGEALSEQRDVSVRFNSFVFEGRLLYCQSKQARYEAHITIDDTEETGLRRAPRFPVKVGAQLFPAHGVPVGITIVDISRDGLGIESPVSLQIGQTLALASESVFVLAVVRHCRQGPGGVFPAGVEMQHLFERSGEVLPDEARSGLLGRVWGRRSSKGGR